MQRGGRFVIILDLAYLDLTVYFANEDSIEICLRDLVDLGRVTHSLLERLF